MPAAPLPPGRRQMLGWRGTFAEEFAVNRPGKFGATIQVAADVSRR